MITLEKFLSPEHVRPRNLYVKFPGFKDLYVRKGPYLIRTETFKDYCESIQIANVTASRPGNGAFRELIDFLEQNYPQYVILVECVHGDLQDICRHMDFVEINKELTRFGAGLHFAKGNFS